MNEVADGIVCEARARRPVAGRKRAALSLQVGARRFAILDMDSRGCVIDGRVSAVLRGHAAIFEGDRQVAQCMIVADAADGGEQRIWFKRRSPVRTEPPADFAS